MPKVPKDPKIVFMGSPEVSAEVLTGLLDAGIEISDVITRPDKPKGRGGKPEKTPVKLLAEKQHLPVYTPQKKIELTEKLKELKPDLCIIAAFGMIIPPEALFIPTFGMINFHPSLLPLYRGPNPVAIPILSGDKKTGVSIMMVSEGMDEGDILAQEEVPLKGNETTPMLEKTLAALGTKMIINLLPAYLDGKAVPKTQDQSKATYTHFAKKDDGRINWDKDGAEGIERASRAFTPWPGIYTYWDGKKIDFYNLEVVNSKLDPGEVKQENGRILIGTLKDAIAPRYIKIEGKNKITAEEFSRGYPNFIGSKLG